jgi:uncharacterized protein YggE
MNKKVKVVVGGALLIAIVALAGCTANASDEPVNPGNVQVNIGQQQEGIWVNGNGKAVAVPDVATLSLGVEAQEATVEQARTEAADAMDKVIAALKDQGVAEKDIQTQSFNIQQVSRWDSDRQQENIIGYLVSNTVTAKVREIEKTGAVIDAVATAGGDFIRINNVGFTVDDPSEYYQQAREEAVNDAAAKAQQLATLSGVTLGKATYITENTYIPGPIYRQDMAAVPTEATSTVETPISVGEMEITVNVQLAYAIID